MILPGGGLEAAKDVFMFLASKDALEVMSVTHSLTDWTLALT